MDRKYTYANGIIYIKKINDKTTENIQNATKTFMERLMKENDHGNTNTSRSIDKKQVLDRQT